MKYKTTIISILFIQIISYPVHSEIYKWTDEKGQLHYGDKPKGNKTEKVPYTKSPNQASSPVKGKSITKSAEEQANELRQSRLQREADKRERERVKTKKENKKRCDEARSKEGGLHRELNELKKERQKLRYNAISVDLNTEIKQKESEYNRVRNEIRIYCH